MRYEKNNSLTSIDFLNFQTNVTANELNRGINHQIDRLFNSGVKVKELRTQVARMNELNNQVTRASPEKNRPLRRPSKGLPHQVEIIVIKD